MVDTIEDAASPKLDREVLIRCARKARRDGVVAGLTSGLLGGLVGRRLFRFDKNITVLCGILTFTLSGFFFTQAFLGSRIAEAVAQETQLRRQAVSSELMPDDAPPAQGNFW